MCVCVWGSLTSVITFLIPVFVLSHSPIVLYCLATDQLWPVIFETVRPNKHFSSLNLDYLRHYFIVIKHKERGGL